MSFIQLTDVKKIYKDGDNEIRPVDGATLSFDKGVFSAVMGASGSGKSTLMQLVGGLIKPDGGSIVIDGMEINSMNESKLAKFRNEYIGFVFQSFFLIPHLTAVENVMLPLSAGNGTDKRNARRVALETLEKVGLGKLSGRLPSRLSGGEQQRVAIARALSKKPLIILADEPTGNLDCGTGGEILKTLKTLNSEGRTIIMVTHNKEDASWADNVVNMRDGKIDSLAVCAKKEE